MVEGGHSNILFFVLKRAAKAMQNCPKIKQQCKDKDNFRNCKFYSTFFLLLWSNHHLIKKTKIIWIVKLFFVSLHP